MSDNNKQNVRQRPVWNSQELLEISGLEFELIYNFFTNASQAFDAANAVLNRNILNGKVGFEFEKLGDNGEYSTLSEDEAKPYQQQLSQAIENAKAAQKSQDKTPPKQKPKLAVVE